MIWGCISWDGVGRIVKINSIMDKELYISILDEDLQGSLEDVGLTLQDIIFQQDNDPKHKAHITIEWLESHGFKVLPRPATSPDMNLIEHVWDYVENELRKRRPATRNCRELWERVQEAWYSVPNSFIFNLYKGMAKRVAELEDAEGWNTTY